MKKPCVQFTFPIEELIDKERLFNKVIEANKEIAIYNEKLKNSKVRPALLMDLFSLKEALESSKIEGTQATMDDMLEYRTDEKNVTDDIKEVINYHVALQEGVYGLEKFINEDDETNDLIKIALIHS